MHREDLVVLLGAQELQTRASKFSAKYQRQNSSDDKPSECGNEVHVPDRLVVGGCDPLYEEATFGLSFGFDSPIVRRLRCWISKGCHRYATLRELMYAVYWAGVTTLTDAILLDIVMPYMDGMEVLGKIKRNPSLKDIPIIMLTNISEKEKVEKAVEDGANDFLIKSHFTPSEVVAKVRILLKM